MKKGLQLLALATVLIVGLTLTPFRLGQRAEPIGGSPQQFRPPDRRARMAAIGSTKNLSKELRRALDPGNHFQPIPVPQPSDWLAHQVETGQTFAQFLGSAPNRPDQKRNKLYFLPLGEFPESSSIDLDLLESFAERFFTVDVRFRPAMKLDGLPIRMRERGNQPRQLLSTDVLKWLEGQVPDDAYCVLALTMEDLYPEDRWNFVFGQASLRSRVGVYSFARYSPEFYGRPISDDTARVVLLRSCKVLSHETGHMFGIKHCTYFHCLMNGSNHLDETDRAPIHLCPVCLRKLQSSLGFNVRGRYQQLRDFSKRVGWTDEAAWLEQRIDFLDQ